MNCTTYRFGRALAPLGGLLALASAASAQTHLLVTLEAELDPAGNPAQGIFGEDVALDGTRAMTTGDGDVYFYEFDGASWVLDQMLELHLDGAVAIDLEGDEAIAGSSSEDFLYVLRRGVGGWAIQQLLQGSDTLVGDNFGHCVALDGATLAVGAPFADSPGFQSDGAVYVFSRAGGVWSEQQILTASQPAGFRRLGWSVDVEGATLFGGADQQNATAGAVFVFERVGSVWSETQMLSHGQGGTGDHFGYSLAISGPHAVIGAWRHQDSGSGVVFRHDGSAWLQAAELLPSAPVGLEWVGTDVAIDGDTIALGGRYAVPGPIGSGVVFLYKGDAASWTLGAEVGSPTDSRIFDGWGQSLALSGTSWMAGAKYYDDGATNTGLAFLLEAVAAPEIGARYCFGNACPCGNDDPAAGCSNSTGAGGELAALGSASVELDQIWLDAQGLLAGQPGLLFAGTTQPNGGAGLSFGDGLRCAGGAVERLGIAVPGGAGSAAWGPELQEQGGWSAGDTRFFQVWYRDPSGGPCASGFNLSNGVRVTFVP